MSHPPSVEARIAARFAVARRADLSRCADTVDESAHAEFPRGNLGRSTCVTPDPTWSPREWRVPASESVAHVRQGRASEAT